MGDFAQNGFVTTLHNFGTKSVQQFEQELKTFSGYRPMELILPSLYSELEGPALNHIVEQISRVDYISHVIIGLDKADQEQFLHASHFFSKLNKPFSLLWNDGPGCALFMMSWKTCSLPQLNWKRAKCLVLYWTCPCAR